MKLSYICNIFDINLANTIMLVRGNNQELFCIQSISDLLNNLIYVYFSQFNLKSELGVTEIIVRRLTLDHQLDVVGVTEAVGVQDGRVEGVLGLEGHRPDTLGSEKYRTHGEAIPS